MRIRALYLVAALACASCGDTDGLGSFRLARSLEGAQRVEVVVPATLDTARLARLAGELESRGRYTVELERGSELDGGAARILIADSTCSSIGALAQLHGIVFEPGTGAVWFQGRRYYGPREGILLTVEDPRRGDWPVNAYIASDAAIAAELASELAPTWKPGFRTWRNGRIEREGTWTDYGGQLPSSASLALERIETWPEVAVTGQAFDVLVHGAVDPAAQAKSVARLASAARRAEAWLGASNERLRVHLWPDAESCSVATGSNARAVLLPGSRDVHVICAPGGLDDGGAALATGLALAKWGEPVDDWMARAFGGAVAARWAGVVPLRDWVAHLRACGLAGELDPSPREVSRRTSPHVLGALRAHFVAELAEIAGSAGLERAWREGLAAADVPWESLRERWSQGPTPRRIDEGRRERALAVPFHAGAHLIAARDSDGRGWVNLGGRGTDTALAELKARGVDALALTPVSYRGERTTWWPVADRPRPFDGTVCDEAVIASARRARALGLRVMLSPQLLDAPSSGLASGPMALTPELWRAYFEDLQALLVHSALVAELADADILCMGTELWQSTDSMRDDMASGWIPPEHLLRNTARWRELVASVREVYSGALTYAAGNLEEARQAEFWDALDLVAFNGYSGLRPAGRAEPAPDEAEAIARYVGMLRELDEFANARGRPWMLAEFGLPPTDGAWFEPTAALGSYDVTEPARLLRAFGLALARVRRERPGLRGVFLWSWTVDPEHGNGVDRSFTLQNRPAADVLPSVFAGQ